MEIFVLQALRHSAIVTLSADGQKVRTADKLWQGRPALYTPRVIFLYLLYNISKVLNEKEAT